MGNWENVLDTPYPVLVFDRKTFLKRWANPDPEFPLVLCLELRCFFAFPFDELFSRIYRWIFDWTSMYCWPVPVPIPVGFLGMIFLQSFRCFVCCVYVVVIGRSNLDIMIWCLRTTWFLWVQESLEKVTAYFLSTKLHHDFMRHLHTCSQLRDVSFYMHFVFIANIFRHQSHSEVKLPDFYRFEVWWNG